MSGTPTLSVVIPSHCRADLLQSCLSSVRQHTPPGTQVIVVDDGSPAAVISDVAANFGVNVIRLAKRKGFCAAANAGIDAANGEIVQLLNDDAELASNVAAALESFTEQNVAAAAPLILRWPGRVIDSAGDCYNPGGFAQPRGRGQFPLGRWLVPCNVDAASACASFYRRDALMSVGRFPEAFVSYFEDVDLSLRLRKSGSVIRFVPGCRVLHRGSSSFGRGSGRLITQQSRNEERLFWRHTTGSILEFAHHLAVLIGKSGRRLNEGTWLPWVAGRLSAWAITARESILPGQAS